MTTVANSRNLIWDSVATPVSGSAKEKTIAEVMAETKLEWAVKKQPLLSPYGKIEGQYGHFRTDTKQFLGFSTDRYKVIQNVDAFDFINGMNDFSYEGAGQSKDSKKIFVIGKYNKEVIIDGRNDNVNFYMTFLHSHDGKSGIRLILSPVRMFCTNQLNYMLKEASFKYTITHTGKVAEKMLSLQRAINNTNVYIDRFEEEVKKQLQIKVTDGWVKDNIVSLFPIKEDDSNIIKKRKEEAAESVYSIYKNVVDLGNYKGTGFGFVNAVSDYVSHRDATRASDTYAERHFLSTIEGSDLIEAARNRLELVA